ncbi:MAG: pilus (MSHA type) biogenesis protein MshL [Marinobacter sp.]|nr:pilus (MSHA type) biogenesis protein MshL [Marinobacter sp.]
MNLTRAITPLFIVIFLSACASNPLLRTGQATSTDGVRAIEDALATATAPVESAIRSPELPESVTQALLPPLQNAPEDERFDVVARELDAGLFFDGLVDGTGYNVVVHPKITGTVSLRLRDVTVPEVMEVVGELYGYDIQRTGRLYRVMPAGLQTRMFPVDYLHFKRAGGSETRVSSGQVSSARSGEGQGGAAVGTQISTATESDFWRDVVAAIRMIVGDEPGHNVIATPGAGLLLVRSDSTALRAVDEYLRKSQLIIQRQVILEAKILEVVLNEGFQQGINWSDIYRRSNGDSYEAGLSSRPLTSSQLGGIFSASVQINDFTGFIELLGTQGNVQILSSPRIATVNNQKAVIKVGTDEFFVTDIDFDERDGVGSSDRTSTSVELTPFFSGISLDVTPQIAEDGSVILHVHPAVSEVEDQQKIITIGDRDVTLPLARSTVRETDSVIRAESGQIVVIGGLIQNSSEEITAAVPFLSEIPLLGELFKQRRFQARKSELVILLRPMVADRERQQTDIRASSERMQVLRELLESPDSVMPQPARAVDR